MLNMYITSFDLPNRKHSTVNSLVNGTSLVYIQHIAINCANGGHGWKSKISEEQTIVKSKWFIVLAFSKTLN